jgi:uroporphyrinogen III methyltransferase/synthase
VIFTSVNGVERFFERYFDVKEDIREMAGPRIGAIGPVTAESVRKHGLKVDLLAKEFKAEGVLAQLSDEDVRGKRFLIPRAQKARDILPEGIIEMGGKVDVIPVYRTVLPDDIDVAGIRELLEEKQIHAITFTSSSTVTHFIEIMARPDLNALLEDVTLASIGPITSRTIKENSLPVHVEASEYTVEGLVNALVDHLRHTV